MVMFICLVSNGFATTVLTVSFTDLVQQSEFVFEGTVQNSEARENSNGRIHTYITFEINEIIKGDYHGETITLRFLGGTIGDVSMNVSEMVFPKVDEHGIYFVETLERVQGHPFYGWSQGHFIVEQDETGTLKVMTNERKPITGVMNQQMSQTSEAGSEKRAIFSRGFPQGLVVSNDQACEDGLTLSEFKKALQERME